MRFAYADPPYLGMGQRLYGDPTYDDVNAHAALIASLETFDGWALSMSSPSLRILLPLCPPGVRVLAWVKGWAAARPNVAPNYAWEPVVYKPGRKHRAYVHDWLQCNPATAPRNPEMDGFKGGKPEAFSLWLFCLAGLTPDDEFTDLFPGSGAVSRAWDRFCTESLFRLTNAGPGYWSREDLGEQAQIGGSTT